jgi:hypothetical protein
VTCVSVCGCVSAFWYVCACVFEKTNRNVRVRVCVCGTYFVTVVEQVCMSGCGCLIV